MNQRDLSVSKIGRSEAQRVDGILLQFYQPRGARGGSCQALPAVGCTAVERVRREPPLDRRMALAGLVRFSSDLSGRRHFRGNRK